MDLPGFLDVASAVILASAPGQCTYSEAPVIHIKPITENIQYDFKKSASELSRIQTNTVSPYGLGADTVTNGLRHDQPYMQYDIEFGHSVNQKYGSFCMWYKEINVTIKLNPKIYVAKEYNKGACGQFILNHEKKHVLVDRKVMNKYAQMLGKSIQNAVNLAGAQGPYNMNQTEEVKKGMQQHIESAIQSVMLLMKNEMNKKQQEVDSLEEYEAGHKACRNTAEQKK